MPVDAATELLPQPHGHDFQKVLASQLSLGDVGEGAAVVSTAVADRTYASNDHLWRDVFDQRLRVTRVVHLDDFVLSEWFPLSPGLFHTDYARVSRDEAQRHLLTGPDRQTRLEEEIGRSLQPGALDQTTRNLLRVYSPRGKMSMMGGGVGCVRLNPRRLESDDVWFMSASSTPIAHEGFPVVLPAALYERFIDAIADAGGLRCRLTGRLHPVSDAFDALFRRVVGVPRIYLLAEQIEHRATHEDETFIATGALTFEAPGAADPVVSGSEWDPVPDLHAAYVTFASRNPHSIRAAAEWVSTSYVEGLFGGRVVSDFDEQIPRFAGAPLAVARLTTATLEPPAVVRIVEKTRPSPQESQLFAQRAERLSPDARDFFISYTAADRVWAEWIAWWLEHPGYTTVVQHWDFRPGGAWVQQMQSAMTTNRRTSRSSRPTTSAPPTAAWSGRPHTGRTRPAKRAGSSPCECASVPHGASWPAAPGSTLSASTRTAPATLCSPASSSGVRSRRARPRSQSQYGRRHSSPRDRGTAAVEATISEWWPSLQAGGSTSWPRGGNGTGTCAKP